MASGFGLNGGRSRCFEFFQEFQKCHSVADDPKQCSTQVEDYLECLHKTKEIARAKEIKAHFLRKQAQETHDKRALAEKRANGVIISLGLVNADTDQSGEDK
ncbi:MAG: hypothetical protein TREMPRED_001485 [Tremellales sp. Tagirdzhanova-0007]|nr:MAG: hypothetical protein TREMPRED_001485 [Tremellales sp. Tagirdzhanova-0007]